MINENFYVIGVDFGTDSVRTVIVDSATGEPQASSVFYYPLWAAKKFCDASRNIFRQHPEDYINGITSTIRECLSAMGPAFASKVRAISVDTTGSTPVAVDESGTPLALLPQFATNPNAMFVLWKDHSAVEEAAEINEFANKNKTDYLRFVGGIYSSEWYWAKLLHLLRTDEEVRARSYSFVEHCDWIPFLLTGGRHASALKRSVCAAGHKALWSEEFGGLPPDSFFTGLDPLLEGFRDRFTEPYTSDKPAGTLSAEWAEKLGLSTDVVVGIGAFDAHMGAVGGQIEPYFLSKVIGTSTCDILVVPEKAADNILVKGICGQVNGSVIPGMIGMEAGQSAFGDYYAWFNEILLWPFRNLLHTSKLIDKQQAALLLEEAYQQILPALSEHASLLPLDEDDELAIDWINGRRTPDANQSLTGAITGINLGTDSIRLFRALVEATCFGAKAIVDRFLSQGIPVRGLIGLGGIANKSPFIMQMLADVIGMPIRIHRSEQTCALGAAMFAATAAGIYPNVEAAMKAMGQGFSSEYVPVGSRSAIYAKRYKRYLSLGHFIQQETEILQAVPKRQALSIQ